MGFRRKERHSDAVEKTNGSFATEHPKLLLRQRSTNTSSSYRLSGDLSSFKESSWCGSAVATSTTVRLVQQTVLCGLLVGLLVGTSTQVWPTSSSLSSSSSSFLLTSSVLGPAAWTSSSNATTTTTTTIPPSTTRGANSGFTYTVPRAEYYVEVSDSSTNVLPPGCDYATYEIDKSKHYDVCVVGAGLSGTVFAERSANLHQHKVLVLDSRPHIGGNCYDYVDQKTGLLRNQYGSHLFHTSIERVWKYLTQTNPNVPPWKPWYHQKFGWINASLYKDMGMVDGTYYVPIPANILTVNRLFGLHIQTPEEMKAWLQSVQIPCVNNTCRNGEEMAQSRVGKALYHALFETYTQKQWNKLPRELDASVLARIPVRSDFDPRYFADRWQALPSRGYTAWFEAMLRHDLIDVVLSTDFFDHRDHLEQHCDRIVYTGPIDRYFEAQGLGKLEYRSIIFTEERHYNLQGYLLPTPVVNYPGPETPYTRAIEYKHYLHQGAATNPHSIVVKETSSDVGEPYYPVPDDKNRALYAKYKRLAEELEATGKIIFVGRCANYKYFDMDKAILNALQLFDQFSNQTVVNNNDNSNNNSTTTTTTTTTTRTAAAPARQ